jgi:hypothetical protein
MASQCRCVWAGQLELKLGPELEQELLALGSSRPISTRGSLLCREGIFSVSQVVFEGLGWSYSDATKVVMVGYRQVAAASGRSIYVMRYNVGE